MQDKTDEKDKENCQLINNYINNPNFGAQKEGSGGERGSINSQQLYNILNKTRQQHQGGSQQSTGSTGGSTTSTPSEGTGQNKTVQLSHLQNLLDRQVYLLLKLYLIQI